MFLERPIVSRLSVVHLLDGVISYQEIYATGLVAVHQRAPFRRLNAAPIELVTVLVCLVLFVWFHDDRVDDRVKSKDSDLIVVSGLISRGSGFLRVRGVGTPGEVVPAVSTVSSWNAHAVVSYTCAASARGRWAWCQQWHMLSERAQWQGAWFGGGGRVWSGEQTESEHHMEMRIGRLRAETGGPGWKEGACSTIHSFLRGWIVDHSPSIFHSNLAVHHLYDSTRVG